jgi:Fe-S-cluster-containing dehydrogenase component
MKNGYILTIDSGECIGCYACEVACKQVHNLSVGPRLISIHNNNCRETESITQPSFNVTYCRHCEHPPCKDVCVAGAITCTKNNIVLINESLCNGCEKCIEACPFNAIYFDREKLVAQKCDLCKDRLDRGLQPACVSTCPSRCIYFTDRKRTDTATNQRHI